jgi:hypothetical protein
MKKTPGSKKFKKSYQVLTEEIMQYATNSSFVRQFHYVAWAGPEFEILLPVSPKCCFM